MKIQLTEGLNEGIIRGLINGRGGKCVRVDGITYFLRLGQVCLCLSARENCKKPNWEETEERVKPVKKFTGLRHMSTHVKNVYEGLPVWSTARVLYAKRGHTSDVYRENLNRPHSDENGHVRDFKHYAMSRGELVMPPDMKVARAGDTVTLAWHDDRDEGVARPTDVLHVIAVNEGKPGRLERVAGLTARRADGEATFRVGVRWGSRVHVYPFFGSEDKTAFSDNDHFFTDTPETGWDQPVEVCHLAGDGESGVRVDAGDNVQRSAGGFQDAREKKTRFARKEGASGELTGYGWAWRLLAIKAWWETGVDWRCRPRKKGWRLVVRDFFINLRRFNEMKLICSRLMIERVFNPGYKLCFSRWNRKGYAIFASLGREVRIGTLAIRVCEMSLRKSSRKGVIVELAGVFGRLVRLFEARAEKMARACGVSFPVRGDAADAVSVNII